MDELTQPKPKRQRHQGRIFKQPESKYFWIQYYNSRGVQRRESSGSENINVAQKLLNKRLQETQSGKHAIDPRKLRYEDLRRTYLEHCVAEKHKSLPRKIDGSLVLGEDGLPHVDSVARVDKFFGGYRVDRIDTGALDRFVGQLVNENYSNGSINRSLSSLRAMFSLAQERGMLETVPTHYPMRPEAKPRTGFFEFDEYRALLNSLPADLQPLLAIGFWTGLRVGEIRSLRWEQIDFLNRVIRLNPGETKNGEGRTAPIPSELAEILTTRYATRPANFPFVCYKVDKAGRKAGRIERVRSFSRAWRNHCVKIGLGFWTQATHPVTGEPVFDKPRGPKSKPKPKMIYQGKLFHDLRRTGVRNLVRAGVPQSVAQDISGHKTASVFKRYNLTDERDVRDAGRKLDNFFASEKPAQVKNGASSGIVQTVSDTGNLLKN